MHNSIILITGGTGTFGKAFLNKILTYNPKEIRIFSRDETKQYIMMQEFCCYPNVKFYIGDVRDKNRVDEVMQNVDYVFHAAAMKQIPICELNPQEAIKTNVIGSNNVLDSAIEHKVKKIVCLSTDKAVYPISTMGTTKLCMEKLALQKAKEQSNTEICVTRFCNLISSNGSVVPLFMNQIKNNQPLTITNPDMTRFFMTINEAVELIEFAFKLGEHGKIYIKNSNACSLMDLAKGVCLYMGKDETYPIKIIGVRQGEKMHELLVTDEEMARLKSKNGYLEITNTKTDFTFTDIQYLTPLDILQMLEETT